jgi:hypothetical protein
VLCRLVDGDDGPSASSRRLLEIDEVALRVAEIDERDNSAAVRELELDDLAELFTSSFDDGLRSLADVGDLERDVVQSHPIGRRCRPILPLGVLEDLEDTPLHAREL